MSTAKKLHIDKDLLLKTVKEYSYYADRVVWEAFEKQLNELPETLDDLTEANNLLRMIDNHSFFVPKHQNSTQEEEYADSPLNAQAEEITADVGKLTLPGFYSPHNAEGELAANYEHIISELERIKDKTYVILDLSHNSGGNMYPWFAALAPLFDTDTVGYFSYAYKEQDDPWILKPEGVYCGEKRWFNTINKNIYAFKKIAVAVSRDTVSSGEAVALALRPQENVRLFGEHTGGFTTGNEDFEIGDVVLWLSTGVMQDREGVSYPEGVAPHIESTSPIADAKGWFES